MHSHVVEFLSAVFARFNVTFYLEYHCMAVSEVSRGKKWSVNPFQTPKVQETEYTYSSANFRNYEKKNKKIGLFYKICTRLFYVDVPKWTSVKLDLFPCLARDRKSLPQRRIVADIFGKEVDLHWREVCSTNSVFIISFGSSRNILSRRAQMSTEICIKSVYKNEIDDDLPFDLNRWANNIPGETQDDLLRIAIDLP